MSFPRFILNLLPPLVVTARGRPALSPFVYLRMGRAGCGADARNYTVRLKRHVGLPQKDRSRDTSIGVSSPSTQSYRRSSVLAPRRGVRHRLIGDSRSSRGSMPREWISSATPALQFRLVERATSLHSWANLFCPEDESQVLRLILMECITKFDWCKKKIVEKIFKKIKK